MITLVRIKDKRSDLTRKIVFYKWIDALNFLHLHANRKTDVVLLIKQY